MQRLVLLALALCAQGCVSAATRQIQAERERDLEGYEQRDGVVISGGHAVHRGIWVDIVRELRVRASVDIPCSEREISLVVAAKQGKFPTLVKADGCGGTALYTRALRRHRLKKTGANTVWTLESVSRAVVVAAPADAL